MDRKLVITLNDETVNINHGTYDAYSTVTGRWDDAAKYMHEDTADLVIEMCQKLIATIKDEQGK